jgi:deazaflavin-dependent oxidoreductase (nitroreductase family)
VGRFLGRLVGAAVVALGALFAMLVIGMRTKSPAILDRVRRFNRNVTNPRVLRTAGAPGVSTSVIRHVGRVSGRPYETPVGPVAVGDDYLIALPYGPGTDWVRNVMAAGGATLVHEGRQVSIDRPEVVATSEVVDDLPASERRTLRIFGVDQ